MKLVLTTICGLLAYALIGAVFALIIAGHVLLGIMALPFAISAAVGLIIVSTDPQKPSDPDEHETLFI